MMFSVACWAFWAALIWAGGRIIGVAIGVVAGG